MITIFSSTRLKNTYMTKINLPTAHLSASQLALWVNDMGKYYKRYFKGEKSPESPSTLLGSRVAALLEGVHENGEFPEDVTETEIKVYQELDFLGVPERRMVQDLAPGITLMGIFDTSDEELTRVVDYKTGHRPWDLDRLRNSIQMKTYALLAKELTGRIPEVGINWMETQQVPGTGIIEFTGRVKKIYHQFTESDLLEFKDWVIDTAHDIARHWAAFQGNLEEFNPDILEAYTVAAAILRQAKDMEQEARRAFVKHLQDVGIKRHEMQDGTFYVTRRKSWEYPEHVEKIAAHLKAAQSEAKENGAAEFTEKEVFTYRAKKIIHET